MAFKMLCSLLVVLSAAVLHVDCNCQNLLKLRQFDVINRETGRVVTRLPLKGDKHLKLKVALDVRETLRQDWFSARISAKAVATLSPFGNKVEQDVPCQLNNGCEFRQMSCVQILKYLGLNHLGCPLPGPKTYTVSVAAIPPIGDLSVHIPYYFRAWVKEVKVTGRLDVWDNKGNQIGCMSKTLVFYKDY